jgi:predicted ATP-dependent protease
MQSSHAVSARASTVQNSGHSEISVVDGSSASLVKIFAVIAALKAPELEVRGKSLTEEDSREFH